MARLGIVSVAAPGHFYPASALGRQLQARGHTVVFFQVADFERRIRAAGLDYHQLGATEFPLGSLRQWDAELGRLRGRAGMHCSIRRAARGAAMVCREAPAAVRAERVDALIVDQCEPAGGSVAESLGLPFVSIALALPMNLDPSVPPFHAGWAQRGGVAARLRNRVANGLTEWFAGSVRQILNQHRRSWGLPILRGMGASFSTLAQLSQLPAALELPGRSLPPGFHHTGPWVDAAARAPVDFPWSRLDPARPLVYASLGTLQNGILPTYRLIAEACVGLDVQLVISLGGGQAPAQLGTLAGEPIVVGYAPQLALIRRAALTICHGGLNTTLESLQAGVPLVVLPVTNDQPGVGARVAQAGVGRTIATGRVSAARLRAAVRAVLSDPAYRARAETLRDQIAAADGLNQAAILIEAAFPFPSSPARSA